MLRDFHPEDAAAVNEVALAAFAQYEGVYSDWDKLVRGVGSMSELAQHSEILVSTDEAGRVRGAVAYIGPRSEPRADVFQREWPIIRMLVVDPAARGQGLAAS